MPMKNPPHPGHLIRIEIIEAVGLTVTSAAGVLRVPQRRLSAVLNGRAALSADMALRLEKAFGVSMELLLRTQLAYDIAQARKVEKKIKVRRYRGK